MLAVISARKVAPIVRLEGPVYQVTSLLRDLRSNISDVHAGTVPGCPQVSRRYFFPCSVSVVFLAVNLADPPQGQLVFRGFGSCQGLHVRLE